MVLDYNRITLCAGMMMRSIDTHMYKPMFIGLYMVLL